MAEREEDDRKDSKKKDLKKEKDKEKGYVAFHSDDSDGIVEDTEEIRYVCGHFCLVSLISLFIVIIFCSNIIHNLYSYCSYGYVTRATLYKLSLVLMHSASRKLHHHLCRTQLLILHSNKNT
jgi:hypothetical protein